jgi:hypothetical protein
VGNLLYEVIGIWIWGELKSLREQRFQHGVWGMHSDWIPGIIARRMEGGVLNWANWSWTEVTVCE